MTHEEFIDKYLDNKSWYLENDILHVNFSLRLANMNKLSLPDNLHINGSLDLRNSKIKKLPNNLYIKNWLDFNKTSITHLPDDIYIGCIWHSGFLSNKQITCLEKIQLDLISRDNKAICKFINPTEKANTLHKLLWKL